MIFGDDFFGGLFDFNGDGHTDMIEAYMGFQILQEMDREDDRDEEDDPEKENDQS